MSLPKYPHDAALSARILADHERNGTQYNWLAERVCSNATSVGRFARGLAGIAPHVYWKLLEIYPAPTVTAETRHLAGEVDDLKAALGETLLSHPPALELLPAQRVALRLIIGQRRVA